jgi:hypothetical protein
MHLLKLRRNLAELMKCEHICGHHTELVVNSMQQIVRSYGTTCCCGSLLNSQQLGQLTASLNKVDIRHS